MNKHLPHAATAAFFMLLFAGCASDSTRSGYYDNGNRPIGYSTRAAAYDDDYDYYPGYEVYYARNHHEYVYRDGNRWVRSTSYPRTSSQVLLSSPSVRLEFRDSPETHHDAVVRRYPHDWRRDRDGDGRPDWRDDNHNGINDADERQIGRDRR